MTATPEPDIPMLVKAKTRVPSQRPGFVYRDDLVKRLSENEDCRLAFVNAPTGYGKTTVLAQWAHDDSQRSFAWLSLSASENDPVMLWRYVVAALHPAVPALAGEAWAKLRGASPDLDGVVIPVLLNALLDVTGRLVLVLDDYHVIENPAVHASIGFLIDHLPRSTQLVLATRTVPPLALSSLVVGGEVLEIGREDLAFDEHETAQALAFSGIFTQNAGSVFRRTEGWPVGVYLAGEGLRRSGPEALADSILGARPLERYVADELLSQLASEDRDFLVRTSILDELSSDLCDHVTGESGSEARLAEATGSNLLISVIDENGEWVRCHPVLREALLRMLRSDDHLDVIDLHRRAHGWFTDHGFVPKAIDHAVAAGDHRHAAELILANWLEYWVTGRSQTVQVWLQALPESVINENPLLHVVAAWISVLLGDATATIRHAEAALKAEIEGPVPDGSLSYPSLLAILQANLWPEGATKTRRRAEAVYEMEPSDSGSRRFVAIFLGFFRVATGDFDGGRAALEEAVAAPHEPDVWTIYAAGQLALLEVLQGRWLEGAERASATIQLIEALGLNNQYPSGVTYLAAAVTAAHRHQVDEARRHLRAFAAIEHAISLGTPFDGLEMHMFAAEAELLLGNIVAARRHAEQAADYLDRVGDGGVHAARLEKVTAQIAVQPVDSQPAPDEEPDSLTLREQQVLSLLQSELTLQEIGHQLYVSRNTAKTHTSRVYKKLGVSSREEAVTRARELDLI